MPLEGKKPAAAMPAEDTPDCSSSNLSSTYGEEYQSLWACSSRQAAGRQPCRDMSSVNSEIVFPQSKLLALKRDVEEIKLLAQTQLSKASTRPPKAAQTLPHRPARPVEAPTHSVPAPKILGKDKRERLGRDDEATEHPDSANPKPKHHPTRFAWLEESENENAFIPERDDQMRLNLDCPADVPHDASFDDLSLRYVKSICPEVLAAEQWLDVESEVEIPQFDASWKLCKADESVIRHLKLYQDALVEAAWPYKLWVSRMSTELSGDFRAVKQWALVRNPSWILFCEAIFSTLDKHNALTLPWSLFTTMTRKKKETILQFAYRIRDDFYELLPSDRRCPGTRRIVEAHVKAYMPPVWYLLHDSDFHLNTGDFIQRVVIKARLHSRQVMLDKYVYAPPSPRPPHKKASKIYHESYGNL